MTLCLPITVDLYNPYPLKVMNIPQYNTGRGALITLTAAGSVIVPDKETLYIYAKKPDGTMVYASCELSGAQVRASFDEQMTAVSGVLDVEIQMVDASGNSITTTIFQINIMASNIDYARIVSSDDFIALRDALAMVSGIGDHTQLATENKSSLVAAVNELHTELEQQNVNIEKLNGKKAEFIQKVYTNITSDQFGFFSIEKLKTDFPNGFKIISAYGKDNAVDSDGACVLPVFSIDKANKTQNYGYVYKASGAAMTPLAGATNMTFLITFLIG